MQMVACFFGKTGVVVAVLLEQRTTVNSEWYTTVVLNKVGLGSGIMDFWGFRGTAELKATPDRLWVGDIVWPTYM